MRHPTATAFLLIAYKLYLMLSVFVLIPFFFFGNAFFGEGVGGTLGIIRDEISYFSPLAWLIFVVPPLLFLGDVISRWWRKKRRPSALILIGGSLSLLMAASILFFRFEDPPWAGDYLRGAYRTEDGRVLVINSSPVAALDFWLSDGTRAMTWTGDKLSYSGTTCIGQGTSAEDFFMVTESAQAPVIDVRMRSEDWQKAQRLNLTETSLKFGSHNQLTGLLIEPVVSGSVPLIIFPEGPTTVSSLENEHEHQLLAGMGLAVFIYDARGVNQSDGRRSDNRDLALADALTAVAAARKAMGNRASTVGLYGSGFAMTVAAKAKLDFAVFVAPLEIEDATLDEIASRQLYIIPGADKEAPARPLVIKLRTYQARHKPIDIAFYPDTQFNIIRSETRDGKSCQAGKAKSFYRVLKGWIENAEISVEPDMIRFSFPNSKRPS